jgi:hypothetical protein
MAEAPLPREGEMSRPVRVCSRVAAAILFAASAVQALAQQQTVAGAFDVRLGPLQIGQGTFEARIGPSTYALGVSARVSGVARMMAGGEGSASAQGAIHRDRLVPELYEIANTAGEVNNAIRLVMRGNAVVGERVEPPSIPLPDRIPVHDTHRRGVIDPLSAFVFPAAAGADPSDARNCERTLRIFDGRARYDIVLAHARTEPLRVREFEGQALVCRARYAPVAGHRRPPPGEPGAAAYADMEAWLAPVPGARALVLVRMQVGTPSGRFVVQATRFSVSPGAQHAAR